MALSKAKSRSVTAVLGSKAIFPFSSFSLKLLHPGNLAIIPASQISSYRFLILSFCYKHTHTHRQTFLFMFWCCHCLLPSVTMYSGIWGPNSMGSLQITTEKFSRHNLVVIKQNVCIYIPATLPYWCAYWCRLFPIDTRRKAAFLLLTEAMLGLHFTGWSEQCQPKSPFSPWDVCPMERGHPQPLWVPAAISAWVSRVARLHTHCEHGLVGQGW